MRVKLLLPLILAPVLFSATIPAFAQVAPTYRSNGMPLSVGFGPSGYDVDWGHGRMYGGTIWADWHLTQIPRILNGLGVEFEARDISLHQNCSPPGFCPQKNIREDTAGGGAIYNWQHFHNFHPYGKFLVGLGSVDFTSPSPTYSHDTRTVLAPGLGFDYRVFRQLWARADYEYQDWGTLLGNTLNPQGFTVGVSYDFSHPAW